MNGKMRVLFLLTFVIHGDAMPLKKNHRLYHEGMMETRRKCEDNENCPEKDSRLAPSKHLSAIEIQEELILISRQLERVLNYNIPELDNSELEFDQSPSEIHFERAHGFDDGSDDNDNEDYEGFQDDFALPDYGDNQDGDYDYDDVDEENCDDDDDDDDNYDGDSDDNYYYDDDVKFLLLMIDESNN